MSTYKLKTGKVGEAVVGAYKKVENAFVDTFLEKPEDGENVGRLKVGKVGEVVADTYKAVEDTVVNGYKKVEDAFVDTFLGKSIGYAPGESASDQG